MTARQAALKALERSRRGGDFSEAAVDAAITAGGLDGRDAALCTRIVGCVLQNTALLDFAIGKYCSVPVKKLEPKVLDILHLSAAQILFLDRVPNHSAVAEGVELCKKTSPKAAGLVNAVLRRIAENPEKALCVPGQGSAAYLSIKYSHPLWLAEMLMNERGYDFTESFFAANNAVAPISAQVNTLKTTARELQESLSSHGVQVECGDAADMLLLTGAGDLTALSEFKNGLFYVQDAAARSTVELSGAAPGMSVLDGCAAPGGKSFAAALRMADTGRIVSCDVSEKKLTRIQSGAARLGIHSIETRAMDGRAPDADLLGAFDLVIADCPCSGLGVIRKKPEIRFKTPEEIAPLPDIQLAILSGLAQCVRPGGSLIYSTCTVLKAENMGLAQRFLDAHSDFKLEKCAEFWPHIHGTDGFFVCRMIKSI